MDNNRIEFFGNIYEVVDDDCRGSECKLCDLFWLCGMTKPDLPCEKADGSMNRHFVLVEKIKEE